jgi:hypothetical protein
MSPTLDAIGKILNVVEILKTNNANFYQVNKIGPVVYHTVDNQGNVSSPRLYPILEVDLTLRKILRVSKTKKN